VVYAKRPFAGPQAVLAYLSRYTHRVAIANSRLVKLDDKSITFRWKNYRVKEQRRYRTMTLTTDEFIRRFLLHVLPTGFHRIRHYGLVANVRRKSNLVRARQLLKVPNPELSADEKTSDTNETGYEHGATFVCPECGAPMIITEILTRRQLPRASPLLFGGVR
jgi:predicted RNA-binding Zn-ribbon protein involved in translation (DUF1610 family)